MTLFDILCIEECNHDFDFFEEIEENGRKFIVSHCKYCNEEQEEIEQE